jgi:hypothetical protein
MRSSSTTTSRPLLLACLAPAAIFFAAFWLLPVAWLVVLPASKGWGTYLAVLTEPRYLQSLLNTLLLSVAVTLVTLVLGCAVGIYLARRQFPGRRVLLSLLTLPLSFPGDRGFLRDFAGRTPGRGRQPDRGHRARAHQLCLWAAGPVFGLPVLLAAARHCHLYRGG